MPETQAFPVVTTTGRHGRVFRKARFLDRKEMNRVEFDDGTELNVSASALVIQEDGSFLLDDGDSAAPDSPAPVAEEPPRHTPPPPQEDRTPQRQPEPAAAKFAPEQPPAESYSHEEVVQSMPARTDEPVIVDDPLFTESVQVEKIPVNRLLDGPVTTRQEGDVTIVPVVEEVIIVQKRLLLREEIRITRNRTEHREPRRIVLQQGDVRTFGADGRELEMNA